MKTTAQAGPTKPMGLQHVSKVGLALVMLACCSSAAVAQNPPGQLVGHRATYTLSLSHDGQNSQIAGGQGLMVYDLKDVCGGWAMDLKMRFDMSLDGGDQRTFQTTQVTWESKDGKAYRYMIKNGTADSTEQLRGEASIDTKGVATATADLPAPSEAVLPKGTLFPLSHTRLLLKQAAAGEATVNVPYFDGTASTQVMEASAVIGPGVQDGTEPQARFPDLKGVTAYPIDLAFYLGDKPDAMPDSEQFMRLFDNGVMGEFSFSLGSLKIKAKLDALQMQTQPGC